MTQSIKSTIANLEYLFEDDTLRTSASLMDVLGPWLILTGLEVHDLLHKSWGDLVAPLLRIHKKLASVLSILDADQAQEAACREIKSVDIFDALSEALLFEEIDFAERTKVTITWDEASSKWVWIGDPKLRNRETSSRYVEARDAVREMLRVASSEE